MRKKNLLLLISSGILLISFVIFIIVLPVKKTPKIETITPIPSPASYPTIGPTENLLPSQISSSNRLEELKNKLTGGYKVNNKLTIEYRLGSNTFLVLYQNSFEEAQKQVVGFFRPEGIADTTDLNFSYINTNPSEALPPPGIVK